ncbi:MAG: DsrE family protein [Dehalococcoidia bacterium]|nr:DsrE family protein [Dehalococcoidia bacterium]
MTALLLVINRAPYDGTDVVWNALRLAGSAAEAGMRVRLFLMNDGVDLAREGVTPEGAEFDLQEMLQKLIAGGVEVRLCQTCLTRCGIGKGETIPKAQIVGMKDLVAWVRDSEKVLSF